MSASPRRGAVIAMALLAVAVTVAVVATQRPPSAWSLTSVESDGYRGLSLILTGQGATIDTIDADAVGAAGTDRFDVVYVPIAEHASATQVARWRAFVEAGGSLVAATEIPGFGPQTLVEDESPGQIFDVVSSLEPGQCDLDALAGDHLGPIEAPLGLASYDVAPDAGSCFGDGRSAAIVTEEFCLGTVTTIGSPALFANEGMGAPAAGDDDVAPVPDNAVVATRLLNPSGSARIAVVTSGLSTALSSGGSTWSDLLPGGVQLAIWQIVAAFGWYAWSRGRRHGSVIPEPQPVTIAASELVSAVGGLRQRQGGTDRAASVIRRSAHRRLAERLGLPRSVDLAHLAEVIEARTAIPAERVVAALNPHQTCPDDATLIDVVRAVDSISQEVLDV